MLLAPLATALVETNLPNEASVDCVAYLLQVRFDWTMVDSLLCKQGDTSTLFLSMQHTPLEWHPVLRGHRFTWNLVSAHVLRWLKEKITPLEQITP